MTESIELVSVTEEIQEILPQFSEDRYKDIGLQPKEILLAYHYILNDNNISQAYIEVYGGTTSPAIAKTAGNKIMKKAGFSKAIDMITDEVWKQSLNVLPLKLLRELNTIAALDVFDYYYDNFTPRKLSDIPYEKRKLINNIEMVIDKQGIIHPSYSLPDKRKVAATLLEILKAKGLTKTEDDGDTGSSQLEAKAMRDRIFQNLPAAGVAT